MNSSSEVLIFNHLRLAIRTGLFILPLMFIFGCIAGWSLAAWPHTHVGALLGCGIAVCFAIWVIVTYYRTRGLMAFPKPIDGNHTAG